MALFCWWEVCSSPSSFNLRAIFISRAQGIAGWDDAAVFYVPDFLFLQKIALVTPLPPRVLCLKSLICSLEFPLKSPAGYRTVVHIFNVVVLRTSFEMFWQIVIYSDACSFLDRQSPVHSNPSSIFLKMRLVAKIHGVCQHVFKCQVPLPWGKTKDPVGLDTRLPGFLTTQKRHSHVLFIQKGWCSCQPGYQERLFLKLCTRKFNVQGLFPENALDFFQSHICWQLMVVVCTVTHGYGVERLS